MMTVEREGVLSNKGRDGEVLVVLSTREEMEGSLRLQEKKWKGR